MFTKCLKTAEKMFISGKYLGPIWGQLSFSNNTSLTKKVLSLLWFIYTESVQEVTPCFVDECFHILSI